MYLEKPFTGSDIAVALLLQPVETLELTKGQTEWLKREGYDLLGDIVLDRMTHRLSALALGKALGNRGLLWGMEVDSELAARYIRAKQGLGLSLAELKLSVRAATYLETADITSAQALVQLTESQLSEVRNVGETIVREVVTALASLGLRLGMVFAQPEVPVPQPATT